MLVCVALISLTTVAPVRAQTTAETNQNLDALFGNHEPYQHFFLKLQKAIKAEDKQAVASMIDYPFRARIGGKAVKVKDAAHFAADYDKIITPKVKQTVLDQTYPALFANWQGVSIGDGEVWFSGVGDQNDVKITAIND
ncbi:hypothetical protein CES85_3683 (plasmid) [Ochrobactrum quorumnocens]|uniref:DUF4440 domain-containing protein n=1 Tax=Ochrobactrum quorumnocens TaxID=271865 RepID=A0A248UPW7_9HYPH|nr:hypothetical protein CES85_3683 [[Ochrobactrum] quorumnocens]